MPSFFKDPPPVRSEAYRRYISVLPCFRCKLEGYTQVCHGDLSKGMGLKTSDLTCWPGCGPRYQEIGCHEYVGRHMSRDERRDFELEAAADTQERLIAMSGDDRKLRALLVKLGVM